MASESLTARQIMFENLPKGHTERNMIVRELLRTDERVPKPELSEINVTKPFIVVGAALTVSDAFSQICGDMSATRRLYESKDWEKDILEDSQELLDFQINNFFSVISKNLKGLCKRFHEKGDVPVAMKTIGFESFVEASERLEAAEKQAEDDFSSFLKYFELEPSIQDRDSVSALTFRELLVRNESSRSAEKIFKALKSTEDRQAALKETSPIIQEILKKFGVDSAGCLAPTWLAGTIVIVADKQHEILLTGASRPMFPQQKVGNDNVADFQFLDKWSKKVMNVRLGKNFSEVINHCTEEFCNQIKGLGGNEIKHNQLYQKFDAHAAQCSRCQKVSASQTTDIFCWALDGNDLEFKPPCIRCYCQYSRWVLHNKPNYPEQKEVLERHVRRCEKGKEPPCTYCAETVAAANLFLLHHGTVVLV